LRLIVGQLPNAIGSPDAAVEDDDRVIAFEIGGDIHRPAIQDGDPEVWKQVAGIELFCHLISFPYLIVLTILLKNPPFILREPQDER
jgi:hypothetical protein